MPDTGDIERVPERSVVLVEEDSGYLKDFYAHKAAALSATEGKKVTYLTTHFAEDIRAGIEQYVHTMPKTLGITKKTRPGDDIFAACAGDLCVIDPFSSLTYDRNSGDLMNVLNDLQEHARRGTSILLVSDMGVLGPQQERLVRSMADGIIRFVSVIEGDKIKRYLWVLKMRGSLPVDKMIPLTITDEGMQIDTRERLG